MTKNKSNHSKRHVNRSNKMTAIERSSKLMFDESDLFALIAGTTGQWTVFPKNGAACIAFQVRRKFETGTLTVNAEVFATAVGAMLAVIPRVTLVVKNGTYTLEHSPTPPSGYESKDGAKWYARVGRDSRSVIAALSSVLDSIDRTIVPQGLQSVLEAHQVPRLPVELPTAVRFSVLKPSQIEEARSRGVVHVSFAKSDLAAALQGSVDGDTAQLRLIMLLRENGVPGAFDIQEIPAQSADQVAFSVTWAGTAPRI